jgi:hypothetical protein
MLHQPLNIYFLLFIEYVKVNYYWLYEIIYIYFKNLFFNLAAF